MKVSIIIVHYHVEKELFKCLDSIRESNPKLSYEIIVVDNDEKKNIAESLRKKFPKVIYIPNKNKGFGQGNNVGAKIAKGKYLFFLNPDTQVFPGTIDNLTFFLKKHIDVAIAAPLLLGLDGNPYQQGSLELTPVRAVLALSFLNKLFPNNAISRKYYLFDWDRKSTKEVNVAPGTAFIIKKDVFKQVDGFDNNLFLYFEEFDLCKRVKALGYKIFIYPKSRIFHAWGFSTKQRVDIKNIFAESRFYYFKKHFGLLSALVVHIFTNVPSRKDIFSRLKTISPLLLSVLIFSLIQFQVYNVGISFRDEGFLTLNAARIIQGDIPYKDFFITTTPGTFYIQSLLMKIFGEFLIIGRLLYIFIIVGILSFTYLLFRFSPLLSSFLLISLAILFISIGAYAFYNIEALLLYLLSFYVYKKIYKSSTMVGYFSLGLISSFIFIIKQSYGLANLITMAMLILFFHREQAKKKLLSFSIGAISISILFFSYSYFNQSLDKLLYYIFYFSREVKSHRLPFMVTAILFIPLFITFIHVLKNTKFAYKAHITIISLIFFIGGYFLLSPERINRLFIISKDPLVYFYLTILLLPLAVIGIYWKKNRRNAKDLVTLSIFSLGLFLASASSGRDYTTVLMVSPFFLPLCIFCIKKIAVRPKLYIFLIPLFFILYSLPFIYKTILTYRANSFYQYEKKSTIKPLNGLKIPAEEKTELEMLITEINKRVNKSESILCFPYCPLLQVLTERRSASYFSFFYPETFRVDDEKIAIENIITNKPSVIVFQRKGYIEPEAHYEDKRLKIFIAFIKANYHEIKDTENFSIYVKNL